MFKTDFEPDKLRNSQLKLRGMTNKKRTFMWILVITALTLSFLPFWNSIQDLLMRLLMASGGYRAIQDLIVPYELRIVGSILVLLGIPVRLGAEYIEWTKSSGGNEVVYLVWNCVGWQTLVLFGVTLLTGLSGQYTKLSKLQTFMIGLLGTYLVNIFRLTLVLIVYFYTGRVFGIVFHDYFSNLFSLLWLGFFWWFSYNHVLVSKTVSDIGITKN